TGWSGSRRVTGMGPAQMADLPGNERLRAAEARSGLYGLFADLWLREPDAEVVALLRRWQVGEPAPAPGGGGIESGTGEAETLANRAPDWPRFFVLTGAR